MVNIKFIICSIPDSKGAARLYNFKEGPSSLISNASLGTRVAEIKCKFLMCTATCPKWNFPTLPACFFSLITFNPGVMSRGYKKTVLHLRLCHYYRIEMSTIKLFDSCRLFELFGSRKIFEWFHYSNRKSNKSIKLIITRCLPKIWLKCTDIIAYSLLLVRDVLIGLQKTSSINFFFSILGQKYTIN